MSTTELEYPLLGGTDGFRDVATFEPGPGLMNPETVAGLTHALVEHQMEQGLEGTVVIAQDTRPSSDALRRAAIDGALASGAKEILDLGILPTPGAQRIADKLGAIATVVITASHNPASDNGWKGMLGSRKPSGTVVRAISDRYWRQVESGLSIPTSSRTPSAESNAEATEEYISNIVSSISDEFGDLPLAGKRFVVDTANGAAMQVTPEVFRRLGAQVDEFCCDGSGLINDGCGAADLDGLKSFLANRPDIMSDPEFVGAVANDGDADRFMGLGIVNGSPVEITGNHAMEALAAHPKQPGIVGTIYTNGATTERLKAAGIDFEYCDNGDVFVTNALLSKQAVGQGWTRGGEFTGHLIDTAWLRSGDGVRAAAWFAAWAVSKDASFSNIHQEMPLLPEKMQKLKATGLPEGDIQTHPAVMRAIKQSTSPHGATRFVVRPSGTEKGVVRVWAEGRDTAQVNAAAHHVASTILSLAR